MNKLAKLLLANSFGKSIHMVNLPAYIEELNIL